MKIGAAAWITAVSPESSRVSANPSSQNGTALLSAAEHDDRGGRWPRSGVSPPRPGSRASSESAPKHEPPEGDDGRLERVDAELDEEERRAPDGGEEQQEEGVAARHGFATVVASGLRRAAVPVTAGALRRRASAAARMAS